MNEQNKDNNLVVLFTGIQKKICTTPTQKIEELLNSNGFNTLCLVDEDNSFYLDKFKAINENVNDYSELEEYISKYRKIYFIGSSSGGFGALKYGILLNIDRITVFSPFTNFTNKMRKQDLREKKYTLELLKLKKSIKKEISTII